MATDPVSLVSTDWLAANLDRSDLRVLDCTVFLHRTQHEPGYVVESGREHWRQGHIPGSGLADLTGDLCAVDTELRFAVPTPEQFALAMGNLGVGDGTQVVLYDAQGSMWAARVWWMLRWIGFDAAAILDGGWKAWRAEDRPISTDEPTHPPAVLTAHPRPRLIAGKEEVMAAVGSGSTCLIDALGAAQYRGEEHTYGRRGHIPGAANVPARDLVDAATGRFLGDDELATLLDGDRHARTVTYCGGGIAASAVAFALTRLGFDDVAVYTASLQEWTADPDAPLVTGSAAG
jgi:thiosulfate/3-mercaptopyruvate sulfurtransferase